MGHNSTIIAKPLTMLEPLDGRYVMARLEERVTAPAAAVGLKLPVLGATPMPTGPELVEIDGVPWLLADPFDDPMARHTGGRQVIPAEPRARLIRLVQAGVEPDVLHIAHELPKGTTPSDLLSLPPPTSPDRAAADARLVERVKVALHLGARGLGVGIGAVALAPLIPLALLAAAAGNLDPILLGGVVTKDGRHVAWTELARWMA